MIQDIQMGHLNKVAVYKLDRLSRNQFDTLYLIDKLFTPHGVEFISMTESFDTATPAGKMMISILSMFAQFEREQIRERMQLGKNARAKTGAWMGSAKIPRGYDYINGELQIYLPEAKQIQEAYDLLLRGAPLRTIEKIFAEKGYVQRNGPWTASTLSRVLKSRVNIGEIQWHKEWLPGNHDPIVSKDIFRRAQEIMQQNSSRCTPIRRGRYTHYLSGLLICARCGARYGAKRVDSKYKGKVTKRIYFNCYSRSQQVRGSATRDHCDNDSWREDDLNDAVFDEIRRMRSGLLKRKENPTESLTGRIAALQKELKSINTQSSRLLNLYVTGLFSEEELEQKKRALNTRKEHLSAELQRTIQQESRSSAAYELIESFESILETGDFNAIRSVIEGLIDTIYIDGKSLNIIWRF
jgi:site-specific DNA recombinase